MINGSNGSATGSSKLASDRAGLLLNYITRSGAITARLLAQTTNPENTPLPRWRMLQAQQPGRPDLLDTMGGRCAGPVLLKADLLGSSSALADARTLLAQRAQTTPRAPRLFLRPMRCQHSTPAAMDTRHPVQRQAVLDTFEGCILRRLANRAECVCARELPRPRGAGFQDDRAAGSRPNHRAGLRVGVQFVLHPAGAMGHEVLGAA